MEFSLRCQPKEINEISPNIVKSHVVNSFVHSPARMQRARQPQKAPAAANPIVVPPIVVNVDLTAAEALHLKMIFYTPINPRLARSFVRSSLKLVRHRLFGGTDGGLPLLLQLLPFGVAIHTTRAGGEEVYNPPLPPSEHFTPASKLSALLPPLFRRTELTPIDLCWRQLLSALPEAARLKLSATYGITVQQVDYDTTTLHLRPTNSTQFLAQKIEFRWHWPPAAPSPAP